MATHSILEQRVVAKPTIAIVVPLFNRLVLTQRFVQLFREVWGQYHRLVFVDDGSTDGTSEWLASNCPDAVVLHGNGNLWWTGATNVGVAYALDNAFDFVFTINNDAIISPDALLKLVESATVNSSSVIGCRLHDSNAKDRIWAIGGSANWRRGRPFDIHKSDCISSDKRLVDAEILPGCGVLIPCQCFREIGLYNHQWYPQYHADAEFTLRAAKAGYRILVDTEAIIWYDTDNGFKSRSLWSSLFSKRSPGFWKPIFAYHIAYCPWYLIVPSILRFYLSQNRFAARLLPPNMTNEVQ